MSTTPHPAKPFLDDARTFLRNAMTESRIRNILILVEPGEEDEPCVTMGSIVRKDHENVQVADEDFVKARTTPDPEDRNGKDHRHREFFFWVYNRTMIEGFAQELVKRMTSQETQRPPSAAIYLKDDGSVACEVLVWRSEVLVDRMDALPTPDPDDASDDPRP